MDNKKNGKSLSENEAILTELFRENQKAVIAMGRRLKWVKDQNLVEDYDAWLASLGMPPELAQRYIQLFVDSKQKGGN